VLLIAIAFKQEGHCCRIYWTLLFIDYCGGSLFLNCVTISPNVYLASSHFKDECAVKATGKLMQILDKVLMLPVYAT